MNARIEELFVVIKHNTKTFGGNKEMYNDAFKAYTSIKFNNKEMAKRHGFAFAEKYHDFIDATCVVREFASYVEHAHLGMD